MTEKRMGERRVNWQHTPEDCPRMNGAQHAMDELNKRLDDGSARMGRIEASVEEVKATLAAAEVATAEHRAKTEAQWQENTSATKEILEIASALKGFIKVVKALGKVVAWGAAIVAPILAIIYTITGHVPPK